MTNKFSNAKIILVFKLQQNNLKTYFKQSLKLPANTSLQCVECIQNNLLSVPHNLHQKDEKR